MRFGALILGIVVSVVLLAAAGGMYMMAGNQSGQHYRTSIDLVRQIQQLSSSWSIEIARVRSDPLADFDSLASFIPRMARLKQSLSEAARRIPDLPDRLANDVQVYSSLLDAKEERVERFKTGYAVVRNSARYLPLAAANVTDQADAAGDESLARSIAILIQNMNLYLAAPSDASRERLGVDVEKLRADSVTYPPSLANALANMLSHAEVLLSRHAPTDLLFQEATSNETAGVANRLTGALEFEIARQRTRATNYERGVLAAVAVLALFWIALALHQRGQGAAAATPNDSRVAVDDQEILPSLPPDAEPAVQPLAADAAPAVQPLAADAREIAATATPSTAQLNAESAMLYRYFSERVGTNLAAAAERVAARVDSVRQTNRRIHAALQGSEVVLELPDGTDLDEEIESASAIASHASREINGIANLAKRFASFSGLPNGDVSRDLVDINACIDEVVAATGAADVAEVTKRFGEVPDIFGSKAEIRLLLAQILDNSVHAVRGLKNRKATIKIDTEFSNEVIAITIIDNGSGIPPERRKLIFKPFYTSRDDAIGLGLTLAGQLAKRYEGGIKVNSLPGQGTVTRITLPTGTPAP